MKYKNFMIAAVTALVGVVSSCTDEWDEHYNNNSGGISHGSLWQAIGSDEQLSNFKAVLDSTGYGDILNGSQVFTVFAPINSEFSEAERDAVIQEYKIQKAKGVKESKNTVIKEFVQNHIALYNYSVSSATPDTTVRMMNGKYIQFNNSSFAHHDFERTNIMTGNGVLFSIKGQSTYEPNLLEYLEKDSDLDSLKSYIYKFNEDKFLPEQSVPGEIIGGKINYLDSVTVMENEILSYWLEALINEEDSNYVMLAPTNKVWKEQVEKIQKYYVYDAQVAERDSFQFMFPRFHFISGTVFSNTTNPNLLSTSVDSVMSTNAVPYSFREYVYGSYDKKYYQYDKPYASGGIFSDTEDVVLSNGIIRKTNEWKINPKHTFLREIVMEAESSRTIDSLNIRSSVNPRGNTLPATYYSVSSDNKFYNKISGHGYVEIAPSGTANFTLALFDIREVLSNIPYDVYVVVAPAEAGDTLAPESQRRPTVFSCALQCHYPDGKAYYIKEDGSHVAVTPGTDASTTYYKANLTNKDGVSVDSVFVGTYTFPTASVGVSEPQVKMLIKGATSTAQVNAGTHTKTLRLDCIVFKPHDVSLRTEEEE